MFLILIISLITILAILSRRQFSHWQRLGFPTDYPIIPYGSLRRVFRKEQHFGFAMLDIYNKFQSKVVGIYMFFKPAILIRDAELARQIMSSDFASFHDRGLYVDEKNDPMSANLFSLKGQPWRALRTKLTPSFSSGNLKRMFDTVDDVAEKLVSHIHEKVKDGGIHTLEIKSLLTTYAVDIIGSVIFGLEIDSFTNPDNEFRMLSDRLFVKSPFLQRLRNMMNFLCPPVSKLMAFCGVRDPVTYRLRDIVQHTIEFREKNGVVRKDLLQSLVDLRNTDKESMSIDMIAANAFLFYIAGSETTAATTSFTLYELSMYPKLLQKAQNEVDTILAKHNLKAQGRYTYDAIQDMKFLDLCVMETTRKYPGLPFLNRECTQDFTVPDTKFTISRGTPIIISLLGIHRDKQYFPEPMEYIPKRFEADNKEYNPTAFMPFGEGPRHCIAQRMGVLNVKVALAKILANFHIKQMERKEIEFVFSTAPVLVAKDGLRVRLSTKFMDCDDLHPYYPKSVELPQRDTLPLLNDI